MTVAPTLGLPGVAVHFSGGNVPRHLLRITVLFDVTTRDKRPLCSTTNGASTKWRCTGRIPAAYGALGPHTVEMDATTSGTGSIVELGTFLVTDLGVMLAAPAATAPGDTVQLRVTASNGNATVARGVHVTDHLPSGLRFVRATAPCKDVRGVVSCGPFRMGARSSRVFVLTTIVTARHHAHLSDAVTIRGAPDPLKRNDGARVVLAVS